MSTPSSTTTSTSTSTSNETKTKTTDKYVVVLPCMGRPYLFGELTKNSTKELKMLQKAVNGYIEPFDRKNFILHPVFLENPKWTMARQFLTSGYVKVYVNEEGREKCVPNMATVTKSGVPLFGDIAVVVPKRVFDIICPDPTFLAQETDEE